MLTDMKQVYRRAFPDTDIFSDYKEQPRRLFFYSKCPFCKDGIFYFFNYAKWGHCQDCGTQHTMLSLCQDIMRLSKEETIRFILESPESGINDYTYFDFAKCVHNKINNIVKYKNHFTVGYSPEGWQSAKECPHCGDTHILYVLNENSCIPYCLYCGEVFYGLRKEKNAESGKRGTKASKWAEKVKERYSGRCALCGSTEGLEAHHIVPWCLDDEQRYNVDNGILLCKKHHDLAHIPVKK